jgi:ubiquinone/menaquinone biosynthesis C-methylase UbiE
MGKWQNIYQSLEAAGVDINKQLEGTSWLDRFIPSFPQQAGKMLDLGCGLGADMLRFSQLGFTPYGLDLEQKAVDFVQKTYGFTSQKHNFRQPLPFEDQTFSLVLSRLAVHYLNMAEAKKLFKDVQRVLQARGKLLFIVNSKRHLELGLQYNYTDALEVSPNFWHLPHDHMKRS